MGTVEFFREKLRVIETFVVKAFGIVNVDFQFIEFVALYGKESTVVGIVIVVEGLFQKFYQLCDVFLVDVLLKHRIVVNGVSENSRDSGNYACCH